VVPDFILDSLRFQKGLPEANRNGEIRSAELTHHGKVNAHHFASLLKSGPPEPPEVVWAS